MNTVILPRQAATVRRPPPPRSKRSRSALPGFGLTLGFSLTYLSLLVLIPLAALFLHAAGLGAAGIVRELSQTRVLHALG
jgi:sulfate transport system permease protein